jgi:hypothetical protein
MRKRGLDLDAHRVLRVIESTSSVVLGEPMAPDEKDQRGGTAEPFFDNLDKINARPHRVYVEEDVVAAEKCTQIIVEPAS